MRGVARRRGSGPIYRREGIEAKLNCAWGRSDWAKSARRRGGGRRMRRGAWRAAWQAPKWPGTPVGARRGQGASQVSSTGPSGSNWPRMRRGRGPPAANGRAAAETEGEMEIGTFLQFSKS
jgi:hypothetical protein